MGYEIGFVGTGDPDADGYAMAYRHAQGYERLDDCELIACADVVRGNAEAFASEFEIDRRHVYGKHEEMLAEATPDVVSVCVPPAAHAGIVLDCARAGVAAIHCEKPMAATWGECREMVETCDRLGVQLTFNHQRRFAGPFREAKALLDDGRIGDLRRIEVGGPDLYDYGTHLFDACGFVTDQSPVEWVLAQVEYREDNLVYGIHQETGAIARWRHENGVDGLASTGDDGVVDAQIRLVGEDGTIEIGPDDGPPLRVRTGGSWEGVDTGGDGVYRYQPELVTAAGDRLLEAIPIGPDRSFAAPTYVERAIEEIVDALREDRPSTLSGSNALQATEITFACWESARRGGRVTLPLEIDDNPLEAMIEEDALGEAATRQTQ